MRRRHRRGVWLWGMAALIAAPGLSQDPEDAAKRWLRVHDGGLTVIGDAPPKRLGAMAADLAASRAALLSLLGAPDHVSAIRTEVVVFRRPTDFAAYHRTADGSPPEGTLMSVLDVRGRIVAFSLSDADEVLPTVRAVLAGDLVDQLLPSPPTWVSPGLVATFAALESDAPPTRIADARPAAFSAPAGIWPENPELPTERRRHDTVATALTRYFLQPDSNRSAQYRRYLRLLRSRAPHDVAFEEAFLARFEYVYEEVRAAAARGYRFDLSLPTGTVATPQPVELGRDAMNLALGDLVARCIPWNTVAAALHYDEIPDDSPLRAQALRGEAYLRQLDQRREDALALYAESADADPADPVTGLLWGWNLLDRFRLEVGTPIGWETALPAEVAKARSLFQAALGAAPHDPHLQHGLGATYLFTIGDTEAGEAALARAHELLPRDPEILADWILSLAHDGRQDEAWEMFSIRLLPLATTELADATRRFLLEEDLRRVTILLQEGELDAAEELLRRAHERIADAATRESLEVMLQQIGELKRQNEVDAQIELFEETVRVVKRMVEEGDIEGAKEFVRPFLDPAIDDDVRAAATRLWGELNARDR